MVCLTHIDAKRKRQRFYIVRVTRTLFGEWLLVREWGRIGSPGTLRSWCFEREQDARKAEQRNIRRRLRHGYTVRA
jgi:predicted DNA-binding WGR domain protein